MGPAVAFWRDAIRLLRHSWWLCKKKCNVLAFFPVPILNRFITSVAIPYANLICSGRLSGFAPLPATQVAWV